MIRIQGKESLPPKEKRVFGVRCDEPDVPLESEEFRLISRPIFRITSKLLILITFSVGLWLLAGSANGGPQEKPGLTLLPVQVEQIDPVGGVIPVELRCLDAQLSSPRAIEKLTCVIKNNTDRFITAGTVAVAINFERAGTELELQSYDTFNTFLQSDY